MSGGLFDWGEKNAAPPAGYAYGPSYRPSLSSALRGVWYILRGEPRSLARDALFALHDVPLPPLVRGAQAVPERGPAVLVPNHYERPGLWMAWPALAASHAAWERNGGDAHWVAISEWESFAVAGIPIPPDITGRVFARAYHVYGILAMAPASAPPRERVAGLRAARDVIERGGIVGLMPEGDVGSTPELLPAREGVGTFVLMLASAGAPVLPVGFYEENGRLVVSFGAPLPLEVPPGMSRQDQDSWARERIMTGIRDLLPRALWGVWRPERPAGEK